MRSPRSSDASACRRERLRPRRREATSYGRTTDSRRTFAPEEPRAPRRAAEGGRAPARRAGGAASRRRTRIGLISPPIGDETVRRCWICHNVRSRPSGKSRLFFLSPRGSVCRCSASRAVLRAQPYASAIPPGLPPRGADLPRGVLCDHFFRKPTTSLTTRSICASVSSGKIGSASVSSAAASLTGSSPA